LGRHVCNACFTPAVPLDTCHYPNAIQEKALLAAIKEEKLREMEAHGVPDKYKSQVQRYKPA
jgi:hypothetical protein